MAQIVQSHLGKHFTYVLQVKTRLVAFFFFFNFPSDSNSAENGVDSRAIIPDHILEDAPE